MLQASESSKKVEMNFCSFSIKGMRYKPSLLTLVSVCAEVHWDSTQSRIWFARRHIPIPLGSQEILVCGACNDAIQVNAALLSYIYLEWMTRNASRGRMRLLCVTAVPLRWIKDGHRVLPFSPWRRGDCFPAPWKRTASDCFNPRQWQVTRWSSLLGSSHHIRKPNLTLWWVHMEREWSASLPAIFAQEPGMGSKMLQP